MQNVSQTVNVGSHLQDVKLIVFSKRYLIFSLVRIQEPHPVQREYNININWQNQELETPICMIPSICPAKFIV